MYAAYAARWHLHSRQVLIHTHTSVYGYVLCTDMYAFKDCGWSLHEFRSWWLWRCAWAGVRRGAVLPLLHFIFICRVRRCFCSECRRAGDTTTACGVPALFPNRLLMRGCTCMRILPGMLLQQRLLLWTPLCVPASAAELPLIVLLASPLPVVSAMRQVCIL